MSDYVENGYVESGYAEGDTSLPSDPANCEVDLTAIIADINLLKTQNETILSKLDTLLNGVTSNKNLSLEIINKVVTLSSDVANIPSSTDVSGVDLSNLVTKDFFMANIPHANNKHLDVYPNGTTVKIRYLPAIYTVFSSRFVPTPLNYHSFNLIYTVHKNIGGVDYYSDYHSSDVLDVNPELYELIEVVVD